MAEPAPVADMDLNECQELKEAVCDAVLERTRRVVSGDRDHGQIVLGDRPSRVLSSGFVLPRLNVDGDDESSDIRIAAHGMDLRIRMDGRGAIQVRPSFCVYVRTLPSSQELFARNGRLVPPADFSRPAKQHLRDQIRARLQARPKGETSAVRAAAREAVAREVMNEMGVVVPSGAHVAGWEARLPTTLMAWRPHSARISAAGCGSPTLCHAPTKLRRSGCASLFKRRRYSFLFLASRMRGERRPPHTSHCSAPLPVRPAVHGSPHPKGSCGRGAPGDVLSEELWETAAWEGFLARMRRIAPDPARLVPQLDIQILVDPLPDPLDAGVASLPRRPRKPA